MCGRPWGRRELDTSQQLNSYSNGASRGPGRGAKRPQSPSPWFLRLAPHRAPRECGRQKRRLGHPTDLARPEPIVGQRLRAPEVKFQRPPSLRWLRPEKPKPRQNAASAPARPLCLDSRSPSGTSVEAPAGRHALNRVSGHLHSAGVPPTPAAPCPGGFLRRALPPGTPAASRTLSSRWSPAPTIAPEGCPAACGYCPPHPPATCSVLLRRHVMTALSHSQG